MLCATHTKIPIDKKHKSKFTNLWGEFNNYGILKLWKKT